MADIIEQFDQSHHEPEGPDVIHGAAELDRARASLVELTRIMGLRTRVVTRDDRAWVTETTRAAAFLTGAELLEALAKLSVEQLAYRVYSEGCDCVGGADTIRATPPSDTAPFGAILISRAPGE
jgi:hypothetical protein